MKTERIEAIFIKRFKELLLSDDYENINVGTLCKAVNVKRQTFYYHFADLENLIYATLLAEFIGGFGDCTDTKNITEKLLDFLINNKQIISRLLKLNADASIEYFLQDKYYSQIGKILKSKYNLEKNDKAVNDINYLLSSYLSKLLVYCISSNTNFKKENILKFMDSMSKDIESQMVKNSKEIYKL